MAQLVELEPAQPADQAPGRPGGEVIARREAFRNFVQRVIEASGADRGSDPAEVAAQIGNADDALDFANARLAAMNAGLSAFLVERRERLQAMTIAEQAINRRMAETSASLSRLIGSR